MKTLELKQMEIVSAGSDCAPCGQAVIMGGMLGGMFGGVGALVGIALVALGPNCLDLQGTNKCE
jgi:hypothetical protein